MKKISIKNLLVILGFGFLRIASDVSYFYYIAPAYYYYDFSDRRSVKGFLISWILTIIFSFLVLCLIERKRMLFSDIVIYCLALVSIVPYLTLIYAGMFNDKYIIMNTIYWLVVLTLQIYLGNQKIQPLKLKLPNTVNEESVTFCIGLFSVLLVIYISFRYANFRIIFNLNLVYEIRNMAEAYSIPGLVGYLFSWSKIVNISLFAYLLSKKRYIFAVLIFLTQVLSFGVDGTKAPFFMLLVAGVVVFLYRKDNYVKYKKLLLWGLFAVLALGMVEIKIGRSSFIYDVVIRRVLFVPAYLGYCYVDFFSAHVPDYFRGTILRRVGFVSPYGGNLGKLIGADYIYHNPEISCNNGLISDAVTNMGSIGIILMPIILILILRLIDKISYGLDEKVYIPIAIYFAIILMNGFLSTALLTHGLIPICVIMILWRSVKSQYESAKSPLKRIFKYY